MRNRIHKPKVYTYRRALSEVKKRYYKSISNIFILFGITLILLAYGPILRDEIWYWVKNMRSQFFVLGKSENAVKDGVFARYLSSKPISLIPENTDFSLIIEKIGVNVPVVIDVPITSEESYNESLKQGVAHASLSGYPSKDPGNVYIFAHASINFWQLGKYATVFNLLRKLENGDKIHVFYEGDLYVYEVINKETYKGWNTYPITRPVIQPILTLQTCDPPGTTLNRLVVTSKLVKVEKDISY